MNPTVTQSELEQLARQIGETLLARGEWLVTAESCTGGWAAQCLTAIAGSSNWFDRGFVTYSNAAKQDMLGVPAETLDTHGAVSEPTAVAMAEGALLHSRGDWAVAITGIAGPGGGSPHKPVGTVCFAWAGQNGISQTFTCQFAGDREAVRSQSVAFIFKQLIDSVTHIA